MKILNNNNEYLVLQSEEIKSVVDNPSDYTLIKVTGNINCCTESSTKDIQINSSGWLVDLASAVEKKSSVTEIKFRNKVSMQVYSMPVDIDLGWVHDNCQTLDCTLQTFQDIFIPQIKEAIDVWFSDNDIESDVTVTISDNVVTIDNLPTNFQPYSFLIDEEDYRFNFAEVSSGMFFNEGSLYLTPDFFNLTTFKNGIYSFEVTILKEDAYSVSKNCFFMDVSIKCKVAEVLKSITDVSTTTSTNIHLMHYALVNGSNCGCSCEDLCNLYKELVGILNKIDSKTVEDCGCD